ncbi:hypothetical protein, partial [Sphingobacterium sp. LRF_L2]|uniref:hypothetical protein n=1 Tax=Sphingobacterium sp. LRF_L2 TaxID=3369421 RepID=UPI003F5FC146
TKFKALIGFSGLKEDGLVVAATTIVNAMTGNANYPDPSPTLESIQALLDDFSSKLAACRRRGSPEDTALKDESRPLLEAGLQ